MEKTLSERHGTWLSLMWYWGPVLIYAAVIFYFSSQSYPEDQLPEFLLKQVGDKLLHLLEYGILAVLCHRAFRWASRAASRQAVALAIVAASFYGLTDEIHQAFVPLREASWLDLVADISGAVIGSVGWHHLTKQ